LVRPNSRSVVRWDDDEWDELAKRVWKKRARHPDMTLCQLIAAVQDQPDWPADRKRKILALTQAQPLLKRLRDMDIKMVETIEHDLPAIQQTVDSLRTRPDKDQLLESLPDQEIFRRFGETVLGFLTPSEIIQRFSAEEILSSFSAEQVFGYVGKAIFDEMGSIRMKVDRQEFELRQMDSRRAGPFSGAAAPARPNGKPAAPTTPTAAAVIAPEKPTLAVVGIQHHQVPVMQSYLGSKFEIIHSPKANNKEECTEIDADYIVVWELHVPGVQRAFLKKKTPHERLISHRGTFNQLVDRLNEMHATKRK
jgi:hypothetical protein